MRGRRILRHLARFGADPTGSVAITVGVAMVALIGSAAVSVDVSTFFLAKRKQQAATDIAAIVAAGQITNAAQAVASALAANGIAASAQTTIEYGTYVPDPSISSDRRFQVAPQSAADTVRVNVVDSAPLYFGSALAALYATKTGSSNGITLRSAATASQANFVAFAIGSRLASLNGGLANAILGKLLGTQLSLSVLDYEALASAQIDLFSFSQALAKRISVSSLTYGQLTASTVRIDDLVAALRDSAAASSSGATAALTAIAQAEAGSNVVLPLASLVDFGPFAPSQIGANAPMSFRLSALDTLTAVAQIAGRGQLISLDLTSSVPGLANTQLLLAIGERPKGTTFARVGRTGAQVQTAQTRILLTARLSAVPPLLSLAAPIFIDLAAAKATVSSLACGPGPGTPTVSLAVLPSLADAFIGNVSASDFSNFAASPHVVPVPIATVLGLAAIDGAAHVTSASALPQRLDFSPADIATMTKRTASSSSLLSSLTQSLVSNLQVSVEPFGIAAPAPVTQAVDRGLGAAAPILDPLLDGVLTTLGVRVGEADAWVSNVKCGGGVLVN